jgi:hypothetical protein
MIDSRSLDVGGPREAARCLLLRIRRLRADRGRSVSRTAETSQAAGASTACRAYQQLEISATRRFACAVRHNSHDAECGVRDSALREDDFCAGIKRVLTERTDPISECNVHAKIFSTGE